MYNPECASCLRLALHGKATCIKCKAVMAAYAFDIGISSLGFELPEDIAEEVKYELYCRLKGKESVSKVEIGLAQIIAKSADTAIYLNRGKEDLAVIDFDMQHNEAYITNGDLIIKIGNLDSYLVQSLDSDRTAYGYYDEKFIPTPFPITKEEMSKAFAGEFLYSFSLPVAGILEFIHTNISSPVKRRSSTLIMDAGQGYMTNDLVIPAFRFTKDAVYGVVNGLSTPIIAARDSKVILKELDPDAAYIAHPLGMKDGTMYVDVYKKFEPFIKLGMYEFLGPAMDVQLHPFDLDYYPTANRLNIPLLTLAEKFHTKMEVLTAYRGFWPVSINGEYLFETLLLFEGFEYVNVYVGMPEMPIILEGVRTDTRMPTMEAVINQAIVGILDKPEVR